MRRRRRLRIKTLMILVTASAIVMAAPGEYRAQIEYRSLKDRESYWSDRIDKRERERDVCLTMDARASYDYRSRLETLKSHGLAVIFTCFGPPNPPFVDWPTEAAFHAAMAEAARTKREKMAIRIREIRTRLLLSIF